MESGWSLNTRPYLLHKKEMCERGELTYVTHWAVVVGTLEQVFLLFYLRGASAPVSLFAFKSFSNKFSHPFGVTFSATSIICCRSVNSFNQINQF